MVIKRPCFNCKDRHLGCHSECEEYINFVKLHREQKENIKKQKDATGGVAWDAICHSHHSRIGRSHKA